MARTTVYCHCHGPWDGRSFMIQCDACDVWYHGHCVGYSVHSLQRCTEAAFRKYSCPTCTHAATVRLTNAPCAATLSAAEMVAAEAQAAERGGSIARSALVPVPPSLLQRRCSSSLVNVQRRCSSSLVNVNVVSASAARPRVLSAHAALVRRAQE